MKWHQCKSLTGSKSSQDNEALSSSFGGCWQSKEESPKLEREIQGSSAWKSKISPYFCWVQSKLSLGKNVAVLSSLVLPWLHVSPVPLPSRSPSGIWGSERYCVRTGPALGALVMAWVQAELSLITFSRHWWSPACWQSVHSPVGTRQGAIKGCQRAG